MVVTSIWLRKDLIFLVALVSAYSAVSSIGLVYSTAIWDEGTHNFAVLFAHDFVSEGGIMEIGSLGIQDQMIDYHSHYRIYNSFFIHPPAYKFVALLSLLAFGPSIVSLRAPSLLFGIIGILMAYMISREIGNKKIAVLSSILMASSHVYIQLSGIANMDVALASMSMVSLYFFIKYEKVSKKSYAYLFGIFTAVSVLMKLSGVLILVVVFLYMLSERRYKDMFRKEFLISIFIVFLAMGSWVLLTRMAPYGVMMAGAGYTFSGALLTAGYWSDTLFNMAYLFSIPGVAILMLVLLKGVENRLVLVWLTVFMIFFTLVYDYSKGFPRLMLPALYPGIFLIAKWLSGIRREYVAGFFVLFILQSGIFFVSFGYYTPVDQAVRYVYENADSGSAIGITQGNQQLYLMLQDRNRSDYVFWYSHNLEESMKSFNDTFHGFGIEMPDVSYVILDTESARDKEAESIRTEGRLVWKSGWNYTFPYTELVFMNQHRTGYIEVYEY